MANTYLCLNCGQPIIARNYRYITCLCGHCEPCDVNGGRFFKPADTLGNGTIEEIRTNNEGQYVFYTVKGITNIDDAYIYLSDIPVNAADQTIKYIADYVQSDICNDFADTLDKSCYKLKHYLLYMNSTAYALLINNYPGLYPMATALIKSKYGFPDATSLSFNEKPKLHRTEDIETVFNYLLTCCENWDGSEKLLAYSYLINNFNPTDIDIFVKTGIDLDMFNHLTRTLFSQNEIKQYVQEAFDDGYYGEDIASIIMSYHAVRTLIQNIDPDIFQKLDQRGTVCTKLFVLKTYIRKLSIGQYKHKKEIALVYGYQNKIEIQIDFDLILRLATPEEAIEHCDCVPQNDAIISPVYELYYHDELIGFIYFGMFGIYNNKELDDEIKQRLNDFLDREQIVNGSTIAARIF